ncbi:MAG: DUF1987 domain-containing protein [Bacteroidales bacterium]|nr:DUF1987 domain-containing protein [Bacteroidales bacterium]
MKSLKILATNESPSVNFNPDEGRFLITGNSMPENAVDFYQEIKEWLNHYIESPKPENEFIFQMNLLNTSSTKLFADIFKLINKLAEKVKAKITWYYNHGDEDIQEIGTDFKGLSQVQFDLVPLDNNDPIT